VLNLTLKGVEVFIQRYNKNNQESYWENYDLIIWKKDYAGYTNIKGTFRNNSWGISDRISVDTDGVWRLPKRYVRHFK